MNNLLEKDSLAISHLVIYSSNDLLNKIWLTLCITADSVLIFSSFFTELALPVIYWLSSSDYLHYMDLIQL